MKLFDTHVHLNDSKFDEDRHQLVSALKESSVDRAVCVGEDMQTSKECIKLAEKYDNIYAAVGVHPHDAKEFKNEDINTLSEMLSHEKVVALGEIGLDYHYDFSPRDTQMNCFVKQLELAKKTNMPVIYHIREAFGDFLPMVQQNKVVNNAVMHCYGGSLESAKICLDAGMYISFTGVITFKNANNIREVVNFVPLDKMFIETDCPYMTPTPYRGKRNEPAYVVEVAKTISQIKNISLERVCEITYNNANNFFSIKD